MSSQNFNSFLHLEQKPGHPSRILLRPLGRTRLWRGDAWAHRKIRKTKKNASSISVCVPVLGNRFDNKIDGVWNWRGRKFANFDWSRYCKPESRTSQISHIWYLWKKSTEWLCAISTEQCENAETKWRCTFVELTTIQCMAQDATDTGLKLVTSFVCCRCPAIFLRKFPKIAFAGIR